MKAFVVGLVLGIAAGAFTCSRLTPRPAVIAPDSIYQAGQQSIRDSALAHTQSGIALSAAADSLEARARRPREVAPALPLPAPPGIPTELSRYWQARAITLESEKAQLEADTAAAWQVADLRLAATNQMISAASFYATGWVGAEGKLNQVVSGAADSIGKLKTQLARGDRFGAYVEGSAGFPLSGDLRAGLFVAPQKNLQVAIYGQQELDLDGARSSLRAGVRKIF